MTMPRPFLSFLLLSLFHFLFLEKQHIWVIASATHDMTSAAIPLSQIPWYANELHWLPLFEVSPSQVYIRALPPVTYELSALRTEHQLDLVGYLLKLTHFAGVYIDFFFPALMPSPSLYDDIHPLSSLLIFCELVYSHVLENTLLDHLFIQHGGGAAGEAVVVLLLLALGWLDVVAHDGLNFPQVDVIGPSSAKRCWSAP